MNRAVLRVISGAGILALAFLSVGCQDENTVAPQPVRFDGNYTGTYFYFQIENEVDTTGYDAIPVSVGFHESAFNMLAEDPIGDLIVFCEVMGDYRLSDGIVTIRSDSNYTRGTCDETFGTGGLFAYELKVTSLSMVSVVVLITPEDGTIQTIKKLILLRTK